MDRKLSIGSFFHNRAAPKLASQSVSHSGLAAHNEVLNVSSRWVRDDNCFLSRFTVDPARRDEFMRAFEELARNAEAWYDEGCNFAFHGWGRNPNEFVAHRFMEVGGLREQDAPTALVHRYAATHARVQLRTYADGAVQRHESGSQCVRYISCGILSGACEDQVSRCDLFVRTEHAYVQERSDYQSPLFDVCAGQSRDDARDTPEAVYELIFKGTE